MTVQQLIKKLEKLPAEARLSVQVSEKVNGHTYQIARPYEAFESAKNIVVIDCVSTERE